MPDVVRDRWWTKSAETPATDAHMPAPEPVPVEDAPEPSAPVAVEDAAEPPAPERVAAKPAEEATVDGDEAGHAPSNEELLVTVHDIRAQLPAWTSSLTDAIREAGSAAPDVSTLKILVPSDLTPPPVAAAAELHHGDLLGSHARSLAENLIAAGTWWAAMAGKLGDDADVKGTIPFAQRAVAALGTAMQHAVYLTFLDDATRARIGQPYEISAYAKDWGLTDAQVDEVWLWLNQENLQFGRVQLPLVLDTQNRCVYHRVQRFYERWWYATSPLWGAALAFGFVALLFFVLQKAGLESWPHLWGWKMVILFVFVTLGALLHVGASLINVNYDNPLRVYDANGLADWLSLRWIAVLRLYIPVTFVVAGLWGAGNVPGSFSALVTAILAGYSADSLFRAAVSNVQAQSSARQAARSSTASPVGAATAVKSS